jgi:hypothetical protein
MLHLVRSFHLSVIKRLFKNTVTQDRNKGRASQAAARGANLYGRYDVTGIVGNMVLENLGFRTRK